MHPFTITNFRGGLAVVFKDQQGKRRRYSLSAKNKAAATAEAVEIVTEFFRKDPDEIIVDDILSQYVQSLGMRPSADRINSSVAMWDFFGPYKPAQITDELVDQYMSERRNLKTGGQVSDETHWRELGSLRDAISFAVKRRLIRKEDVPFIKRPPKPAPRDRKLSRKEAIRLIEAAEVSPHLYIAILLLLGTAGRISAILQLTWDRVDFENGTIDLRLSSKGPRKGRAVVPMNPGLRRELLRWKASAGPISSTKNHVVTFNDLPVKSIRTTFRTALKSAELTNVRIHDLRHTAAVWMLEAGSSIQRISQYLGHSSLQQTFKVYARYQPDFLRPEADALDVSKLLPDRDWSGVPSETKQPTVNIQSSKKTLSIQIDRDHDPDFAAFVETRAIAVIGDLWLQYSYSHPDSDGKTIPSS